MSTPVRLMPIVCVVLGLIFAVQPQARAQITASPDDTARFLAGLSLPASSPLAELAKARYWQGHARAFNAAWARLEKQQLSNIRRWVQANIGGPRRTMFYMFSGPDYLYANAFYPNADTYVLSGLEPVGQPSDFDRLGRYGVPGALAQLRASLGTVLNYSFFITKDMRIKLGSARLKGALPLLYVFLARSGKTIHTVDLVKLSKQGRVIPRDEPAKRSSSPGVKITFSAGPARKQTLYYFRTDLSNGGVKRTRFLEFTARLGPGSSLIKSASYLLHSGAFSATREFILNHSAVLVQDDSGVPLRYFKRDQWKFQPFGRYLGPIPVFPGRYQHDLRRLFTRARAPRATFGIGYMWRLHQTNILLAKKQAPSN
jgi:hypothetical protein